GYDVAILPAPDGLVFDGARLGRLAGRFMAASEATVSRGERTIDVRGRVESVEVTDPEATAKLVAALDWPEAPALVVARVTVSPDGSAKPVEVARALGLDGQADAVGRRARLARLGFAMAVEAGGIVPVRSSAPAASSPAVQG